MVATRPARPLRHVAVDPWPLVVWRLLAGFGGGYGVTSGFVALAGSALPLLGLARGEALSLALLAALFVYVPLCLAMIASRAPLRDGLAVFGAAAALIGRASVI